MVVRLRISQSVSLPRHSGNPRLQMRVTLSLSVVPSSEPMDVVLVSSCHGVRTGRGNFRKHGRGETTRFGIHDPIKGSLSYVSAVESGLAVGVLSSLALSERGK
jgi:hypothetical protein